MYHYYYYDCNNLCDFTILTYWYTLYVNYYHYQEPNEMI